MAWLKSSSPFPRDFYSCLMEQCHKQAFLQPSFYLVFLRDPLTQLAGLVSPPPLLFQY